MAKSNKKSSVVLSKEELDFLNEAMLFVETSSSMLSALSSVLNGENPELLDYFSKACAALEVSVKTSTALVSNAGRTKQIATNLFENLKEIEKIID